MLINIADQFVEAMNKYWFKWWKKIKERKKGKTPWDKTSTALYIVYDFYIYVHYKINYYL